jgi:chemotaxis protein MotB
MAFAARSGQAAALAVLLGALCTSGCAFVSKSRFDAAQNQNRTLSEQNRAQLAEIENLKNHSHQIEDRLMQAEGDLAQLDQKYGVSLKKLANLGDERELLRDDLANLAARARNAPAGVRGRLAELSQRYPMFHYDEQTGIAKVDSDILFDSGEDFLKPGAEQMLRELAAVLNAPQAEDLKVMVVGHTDDERIAGRETRHRFANNWYLSTARAVAVADQLQKEGVDQQRLGVAGFAENQPLQPNQSPLARQENRRVEIFVMGPDVPVVGMTETLTNLY